jgi:CRISPR-associated protein Cmr4
MGSGDVNYNVIDLEVERDPVLGEPTMNSSGVKGALRDYCEKNLGIDGEDVFGSKPDGEKPGRCNFFSGDLLARPVRVSEGNRAYVLATTPDLLRHVQDKMNAFGLIDLFNVKVPEVNKASVLYAGNSIQEVEGRKISNNQLNDTSFVERVTWLLGTNNWVIMNSQTLREYELPVIAHNVLEDGISKNLWYEEVVPHKSVFGLIVQDTDDNLFQNMMGESPSTVQFGAGASTGYGFTKMERMMEG